MNYESLIPGGNVMIPVFVVTSITVQEPKAAPYLVDTSGRRQGSRSVKLITHHNPMPKTETSYFGAPHMLSTEMALL
jgi:hypothetical protein